jgi:SAM-dependent methyltransferase
MLRKLAAKLVPLGVELPSYDKAGVRKLFLTSKELARPVLTLDVGFGNGYFTAEAAKHGPTVGISLHESELGSARARYGHVGNLRFERVSLQEMKSEGGFDQVIMLDVLEHIRDDIGALNTVARLLVPGGRIVLTVPNRDFEFSVSPHVSIEESGWHVRHGYTFEQLEAQLVSAGFEPIDRRRYGNWFTGELTRLRTRAGDGIAAKAITTMIGIPFCWLPQFGRPHTLCVIARKR